MATRAEIRAEELVYEIAEELGLTEAEVLQLDPLAVVDGVLRDLRSELARQVSRPPAIEARTDGLQGRTT